VTIYVDSSALLRVVLREPGALAELRAGRRLMSSELLGVECLRTIDRLRLQGSLSVEEAAVRGSAVNEWLEAIDLVLLRPAVLGRAGEPLPAPLGTLDAIHLSTALVWRDRVGKSLTVATHDAALGLAARSFGFAVIGS
jgi:predicted nucleic acid-binding protein